MGKAIFPVVIRRARSSARSSTARRSTWSIEGRRRGLHGSSTASAPRSGSRRQLNWDASRPPFPGFLYFDQEDAGIYFGRDPEVEAGDRDLDAAATSGGTPAGVDRRFVGERQIITRPRGGAAPTGEGPVTVGGRPAVPPGPTPSGELARALAVAFPDGPGRPDWKALRDRLKAAAPSGPATPVLAEVASDLTMALGRREASVLLVLDQAEELIQGAGPARDVRPSWPAAARPVVRGSGASALLTLRSRLPGQLPELPRPPRRAVRRPTVRGHARGEILPGDRGTRVPGRTRTRAGPCAFDDGRRERRRRACRSSRSPSARCTSGVVIGRD